MVIPANKLCNSLKQKDVLFFMCILKNIVFLPILNKV